MLAFESGTKGDSGAQITMSPMLADPESLYYDLRPPPQSCCRSTPCVPTVVTRPRPLQHVFIRKPNHLVYESKSKQMAAQLSIPQMKSEGTPDGDFATHQQSSDNLPVLGCQSNDGRELCGFHLAT